MNVLFSRWIAMILVFVLASSALPMRTEAVSTSSQFIVLYGDKKEAYIGSKLVTMDSPARVVGGRMYVPARFVSEAFGQSLTWDAATNTIKLTLPKAGGGELLVDNTHRIVTVGGKPVEYDGQALMDEHRLLLRLTWVMDLLGAKYKYNGELNRVEIYYTEPPKSLLVGQQNNSRPVAKFAFDKPYYRLGEPVRIIDLSYDVDLEGIVSHRWHNRQDVYFKPGTYHVSLQVTDSNGNQSYWFERPIEVKDEPYLSELEYQVYHKSPGSYIDLNWSQLNEHFFHMPELSKRVTYNRTRKLIVSDSPETVVKKGILYEDKANGQVRLYADHVNGTDKRLSVAIMAANPGGKPVTVRTTRQGEVYPSIYANLIGHQATLDFLAGSTDKKDLILPAGGSQVYALFPEMLPGQGINLFYDLEMDGEVTFTFVAFDASDKLEDYRKLPKLPFDDNVRGTFEASGVLWRADANDLAQPRRIIIGDGVTDTFVTGYDAQDKKDTYNLGNYGVTYQLRIDNPPRMTLLLLARGGVFKGPFLINGELTMAPAHGGVITPLDGVHLLYRTTGNEPYLDIEFSPPAGSAFPVDLILYPLEKR